MKPEGFRDRCMPVPPHNYFRKRNFAIDSVSYVVGYSRNPIFLAYICVHFGKVAPLNIC